MIRAVRCDAAAGVFWAAAADPIPALARTTPAVMVAATIPRPDTCGIDFPISRLGSSVSGTRQPQGRTGAEGPHADDRPWARFQPLKTQEIAGIYFVTVTN